MTRRQAQLGIPAIVAAALVMFYLFTSGSLDALSGLVALLVGYALGIIMAKLGDLAVPAEEPDEEVLVLSACCGARLEWAEHHDAALCQRCRATVLIQAPATPEIGALSSARDGRHGY